MFVNYFELNVNKISTFECGIWLLEIHLWGLTIELMEIQYLITG